MGTVRSTQETLAQPHTESSTEAMDTDEGQRTTARLIERGSLSFCSYYGTNIYHHRGTYNHNDRRV